MTEKKMRSGSALSVAVLIFFAAVGLGAQSPAQLGAEILRLEAIVASGAPVPQRRDALSRLAHLRRLSGAHEEAANLWLAALALDPSDDASRLSAARGLAAIGEWEKAMETARPLAERGSSVPLAAQARYLYATLRAWTSGDSSELAALAENTEAPDLRPAVYYTLWWTHARGPSSPGAEAWRQRLLSEFPESPEARIIAQESGAAGGSAVGGSAVGGEASVSAVHSPLWLLLPGFSQASAPEPVPSAPAFSHGQQTGSFRSEANARSHAQALISAGFEAILVPRAVNGETQWAVIVPTPDAAATARDLRSRGYDSFTVRLE